MRFCPKCGSLLRPQRKEGKVVLLCTKCGYVEENVVRGSLSIRREIVHTDKEKTIIIESPEQLPRIASIAKVECPKCGNKEAYVWMMQTRRADEPPTRFYRCTRCGHTWREYE